MDDHADKQVIVVTGNPADGFQAHGPFPADTDDALRWAEKEIRNESFWLMPLESI